MFVDQLSASPQHRLNQILHTLKHVHECVLPVNDPSQLQAWAQKATQARAQIVETHTFNTYMQQPAYVKASLILEAVKMLTEVSPKRRKTVKEHEEPAKHMLNEGKQKPDYLDLDKDGNRKESMKQAAQQAKSNKLDEKTGSKPDFLDMDKDGDRKESMKKALADKKKSAIKEFEETIPSDEAFAKIKKVGGQNVRTTSDSIKFTSKQGAHHVPHYDSPDGHRHVKMKDLNKALSALGAPLMEDQNLDKAQTLLAAKDLTDRLQKMAEDAAKMAVDDLMPLVDTMKDQFGLEQATAFNNVVKQQLQTVLDSIIAAKDQTDNAINTMESGGMPAAPSDIGQPLPPMGGEAPAPDAAVDPMASAPTDAGAQPPEGEIDFEKEFAAQPATSGPEQEPLGRAKKEVAESVNFDDRDLDQLKKFTNLDDMKRKALDMIRPKGARAMKPEKIAWFSSAIKNATSTNKLMKLMYDMLLSGEGHAVLGSKHSMQPNKYRQTFGETEQPHQEVAEATLTPAQQKAQADLAKHAATQMVKTRKKPDGTMATNQELADAKKIMTEKLTKKMTSGEVISDFVHSDDPKFKGKSKAERTKMALGAYYAMHPEKKVKESRAHVYECKAKFDQAVQAHRTHVSNLTESWINQQGDLRSAVLQANIKHAREQLQEAIANYKSHKQELEQHVIMQESIKCRLQQLEEQMNHLPYGVSGTLQSGKQFRKFFESAELRDTWLRYNQSQIAHMQHVDVDHMQQIHAKLSKLI